MIIPTMRRGTAAKLTSRAPIASASSAADLHREDGRHAGTEEHDRNLGGIQAELVTK